MMKRTIFMVIMVIFISGCSQVTQEDLDKMKDEVKQEIMSDIEHQFTAFKDDLEELIITEFTNENSNDDQGDKPKYIELGLTKEEVMDIMGTPDSIQTLGKGGRFKYGNSSISFNNFDGLVDGWNNADGNLKLK